MRKQNTDKYCHSLFPHPWIPQDQTKSDHNLFYVYFEKVPGIILDTPSSKIFSYSNFIYQTIVNSREYIGRGIYVPVILLISADFDVIYGIKLRFQRFKLLKEIVSYHQCML